MFGGVYLCVETDNFSFVEFFDLFLKDISVLLYGSTEDEAHRIGRVIFGLFGLLRTYLKIGKPRVYDVTSNEVFRSLVIGWNEKLRNIIMSMSVRAVRVCHV